MTFIDKNLKMIYIPQKKYFIKTIMMLISIFNINIIKNLINIVFKYIEK